MTINAWIQLGLYLVVLVALLAVFWRVWAQTNQKVSKWFRGMLERKGRMVAMAAAGLTAALVEVFEDYFQELNEESIRDNFVITYELLDEMMDFGYPQFTESKILQEYITQESHKLDVGPSSSRPPMTVTNAVSWRPEGIRHRKNEVPASA